MQLLPAPSSTTITIRLAPLTSGNVSHGDLSNLPVGTGVQLHDPGLTAGTTYTVRLHFAELTWTAAGQRKFNVAINGTNVLTAFDVFAAAGGRNRAISEQFTAAANESGQIVIGFSQAGADNPEVSGIEVLH
jgi:hypothetical protein